MICLRWGEDKLKYCIEKIVLHRLHMRLNNPFTTSFGTVEHKDFFIVEMIDEKEHRGYGESVAFTSPWYTEETVETTLHMMKDFLIPILQKTKLSHPDDVSEAFSVIRGNHMAKAALEGAVWDLYAKQKKMTLAEALGGTKKRIDVGISLGIEEKTENLLRKIEHYVKEGYKRVKLKIKPGHDISVLEQVRKTFPTLPLMVDANSAYTLDDIDHLRKLDAFDLLMIEQPLAHDDIIDHAKLQSKMTTPICLDESIHSFDDVRHAIDFGSCRVINVKTGRVGGLTEAKKIHDYCLKHNIDVWCGGMLEAGVGRAHNIALTTLAGFTLPGDTAGSNHYWQKDIIEPEVVVKNGTIEVPNGFGIGYEVDEETLERYRVDKLEFYFE